MCMTALFPKKDIRKLINKVKPRKGKTVYKIVGVSDEGYHPTDFDTLRLFKVGVNEADTSVWISTDGLRYDAAGHVYKSGFHFYQGKKEADEALVFVLKNIKDNRSYVKAHLALHDNVLRDNYVVIACHIKKSWITTIGVDGVNGDSVTIVTKKAIFPDSNRLEG